MFIEARTQKGLRVSFNVWQIAAMHFYDDELRVITSAGDEYSFDRDGQVLDRIKKDYKYYIEAY